MLHMLLVTMATLYIKKGSPFYYLRYKEESGKWRDRATTYRHDLTSERKKARAYAAEINHKELKRTPVKAGEAWDFWVLRFMRQAYAGPEHDNTLARYELSWRNVHAFLQWKKILVPRMVTRALCKEYHSWRVDPYSNGGRIEGVLKCGHNTARLDLKVFSLILDEAVNLGFADSNPAYRLGIKKIKAKEKRPFTNEEIMFIRKQLADCPTWMSVSFELGLHQALRLRQTSFPLICVDFERGVITYPYEIVKGSKPFSHPIDQRVRPLLERIRDSGAKLTCDMPPEKDVPSIVWHDFFEKNKIEDACFHCTRVTWITRAAIAGVPISQAMRFVNHGSEEVHRIYTKLQVDDIMGVPDQVAFPAAS